MDPESPDTASDVEMGDESDSDTEFEELSPSAKTMLMNIFKFVRTSVVVGECYGDPYECYIEETSKMSGIPKSTVRKVHREFEQSGKKARHKSDIVSIFLSDRQKSTIRSILHKMYENGDVPCYLEKILRYLKLEKSLPQFGLPILKIVLDSMRYVCVKKHGNIAIIEFNDYVLERVEYLKKIKEYREQNRRILYLDEILIQVDYEDNSGPSQDKKIKLENEEDTTLKDEMYLGHIGNENGFIKDCEWLSPVVTHQSKSKISAKCFQKWFADILPKLRPKDVVVMDHVDYHCGSIWTNKTVEVKKKFHPLIQQKQNKSVKVMAVHEMSKKYDIDVLILPHFHSDLNPLKDMWYLITNHIAKYNDGSKPIKELLIEATNSVPNDIWITNMNKVKELEKYLRRIDHIIDEAVDEHLYKDRSPDETQKLNLACVEKMEDDTEMKQATGIVDVKKEVIEDETTEGSNILQIKEEPYDEIIVHEEPLIAAKFLEQTEPMIKQECKTENLVEIDPLLVETEFP